MRKINGLKFVLLGMSCIFLTIGLTQSSLVLYAEEVYVSNQIAHAIVTVGWLVLGVFGITKFIYDL